MSEFPRCDDCNLTTDRPHPLKIRAVTSAGKREWRHLVLCRACYRNRVPWRGFASLPPKVRQRIAAQGGRTVQEMGAGHQFTAAEAVKAGRKGGSSGNRGKTNPRRRKRS